VKKLVLK
jgi:hypothetical protein